MRLDLSSPSLAQYHWGTLFCRFSPAVQMEKKTFLNTAVSLLGGLAPWTEDNDFIATVALLHELSHLAQDLTTGIGHTDYLTHLTQDYELLQYAAIDADHSATKRPPYCEHGGTSWLNRRVDRVHDQLKYLPFEMMPLERLERTRKILQDSLNQTINDELLFDISTQTLLETDAALTVLAKIKRCQMTELQQSVLERNKVLIDVEALGPEYWKAMGLLGNVIGHHCGLEPREVALVINPVFCLFVDSALACPPIEWILARGEVPDDYEPGVKYFRLIVAIQKLAGNTMDKFWSAISESRLGEAESILLSQISFPYPRSEDVYKAWITALQPHVPKRISAEIRLAACHYRIEHGALLTERGIDLLISMQAPILYLHKDHGFVKHDWGLRAVDSNKNISYTRELVDHFMIMELAEFLLRTGEFRCPHAQADICQAVEDRCMSGFVNPAQFPNASSCIARSVLVGCGFDLQAG